MAIEFAMPKLGLTMESGTILGWLVPDGAQVNAGEAVLLVETDKVETEIEASGSGVLHQTGVVGENYECGIGIGWFLEAGESPPVAGLAPRTPAQLPAPRAQRAAAAAPALSPTRAPGERVRASPAAKRLAGELGVELAAIAGTGPNGRITERDVRAADGAPESSAPAVAGDVAPAALVPGATVSPPATLAARQLGDLLGVDLRSVHASAADGRISRVDVAAHVRALLASLSGTADAQQNEPTQSASPTADATSDEAPPLSQIPTELIPLRGMRGIIADRMSASLRSTAQLTLTMDVDMSAVVAERAAAARNRSGNRGDTAVDEPVPGYTDYVVAAAAVALGEHPRVNSQVTAEAVALLGDIHVGLAVALDDGLLVPVVRHADRLSLTQLAAETNRLASGARDGALAYDDYQGATFTVTALGMFGVDAFTPIINSPNTAILGVGRIRNDTDWSDPDQPVARPVLTLSLTWDHRAFDGAPAARFAAAVRNWLESR